MKTFREKRLEKERKLNMKFRKQILKKKWKSEYMPKVLESLPTSFQNNYHNFLKPPGKTEGSVFIHGKVGSGKTVLACFIFLRYVKKESKKIGVYFPNMKYNFINFSDLIQEMQNNFENYNYTKIYNKFLKSDILVLDDLGAKKITDWVGDVLYHIINYRYANMLTTIITSNLNLDELADFVGDERVTRRIYETYQIIEKEHFNKVK